MKCEAILTSPWSRRRGQRCEKPVKTEDGRWCGWHDPKTREKHRDNALRQWRGQKEGA